MLSCSDFASSLGIGDMARKDEGDKPPDRFNQKLIFQREEWTCKGQRCENNSSYYDYFVSKYASGNNNGKSYKQHEYWMLQIEVDLAEDIKLDDIGQYQANKNRDPDITQSDADICICSFTVNDGIYNGENQSE